MNHDAVIRPPTIVVVDDEPAVRNAMSRFFERRGWHCIQVADGAAAEQVLFAADSASDFDVVLCDLQLPLRSGLELYHRAELERPEIADRFVLSSGDTEGVVTKCPVLAKPFPLAEVASMADAIRSSHHVA
jgi:DNA-binding response OmpR family regulator